LDGGVGVKGVTFQNINYGVVVQEDMEVPAGEIIFDSCNFIDVSNTPGMDLKKIFFVDICSYSSE
jgi:hypothetical protein